MRHGGGPFRRWRLDWRKVASKDAERECRGCREVCPKEARETYFFFFLPDFFLVPLRLVTFFLAFGAGEH